ncbi:unnamed protein product [Caenorhabditis brenneri]
MSDRREQNSDKFHGVDSEFVRLGKKLDKAEYQQNKNQETNLDDLNKNQSVKSDFKLGNDEKRKVPYDKNADLH